MWTWRLYYKKSRGFPYIWSVDQGHIKSQIVVKDFHIGPKCQVTGGHDFTSGIENSPQAFMRITAHQCVIENDEAYFS